MPIAPLKRQRGVYNPVGMSSSAERIERLRRTLERYDKLVVEEANRYMDAAWLESISQPAPDLIPPETTEEVEAEVLRFLEERARVREELAEELRRARNEARSCQYVDRVLET